MGVRVGVFDLQNEKGNVLFLILIAVALFAALSFAITSSTRTTSGDTSKDKDSLVASQILQHGAAIQNALMRMKLINGCNDSGFSFANSVWKEFPSGGPYPNSQEVNFPNAPVNRSCHVFSSEGGSVAPQNFPDAAISNQTFGGSMSGTPLVTYGVVNDVGTAAPELLMYFPHIKRSVCEEVYKKLGLTLSGWGFGGIPHSSCTFAGYQNAGVNFPSSPSCGTNTAGMRVWCATDTNNNAAYLFYVVLER